MTFSSFLNILLNMWSILKHKFYLYASLPEQWRNIRINVCECVSVYVCGKYLFFIYNV